VLAFRVAVHIQAARLIFANVFKTKLQKYILKLTRIRKI